LQEVSRKSRATRDKGLATALRKGETAAMELSDQKKEARGSTQAAEGSKAAVAHMTTFRGGGPDENGSEKNERREESLRKGGNKGIRVRKGPRGNAAKGIGSG